MTLTQTFRGRHDRFEWCLQFTARYAPAEAGAGPARELLLGIEVTGEMRTRAFAEDNWIPPTIAHWHDLFEYTGRFRGRFHISAAECPPQRAARDERPEYVWQFRAIDVATEDRSDLEPWLLLALLEQRP